MHVVVHDDDALHAERQRVRSGGGDVVVEAESHRPIALGVMARRPHERHHARRARLHDGLDAADGGSRREQRHVARFRRRVGVRIERHRAAGRLVDRRQVRVAVHAPQLGVRRRPRRLDDAAPLLPRGGDAVHHLGALDALRMTGRRPMIGEPIGVNQDQ